MIEAFRQWASVVNTALLSVLVTYLIRGQQRMAAGKVRIARGSEDRAASSQDDAHEIHRETRDMIREMRAYIASREPPP